MKLFLTNKLRKYAIIVNNSNKDDLKSFLDGIILLRYSNNRFGKVDARWISNVYFCYLDIKKHVIDGMILKITPNRISRIWNRINKRINKRNRGRCEFAEDCNHYDKTSITCNEYCERNYCGTYNRHCIGEITVKVSNDIK